MLNTTELTTHLKSIWSNRVKRSPKLIVDVSYHQNQGHLNNAHWAFEVPYAFREALDLSFDERIKDKKRYMVWTQGPILRFKEGDVFQSSNRDLSLQVQYAIPMGWDIPANQMSLGVVTYIQHGPSNSDINSMEKHSCTQMEFLTLLIDG